ncbi:MAG: hypothetical protein WCH62_00965 [Candidatus Omnitrophota bacterium]
MVNRLLNRRLIVSIVALLVVSVSLSACETLRKKFTRKKKAGHETQDFQPVLEPQEYPSIEHSPVENYKQHYALIKAWYKDLWTGIDEKNTDKTVKYSIKQILDHIDQMKLLLKGPKAQELDQLAGLLKYYKESLDQPRQSRNYPRIESDLRAFDRTLRANFRDDKFQGEFVNNQ